MNLYAPFRRDCARTLTTLLLSLLITLAVASQLLTTQAATTFVVNSLGDTPDAAPGNGTCADANGACTLRAAIQEANVVSGVETINFSVTGTINLTGALPSAFDVNINGPGAGLLTLRRDTGGDYRIIQISGVSSIFGITITNGRTPDSVGDATAPSGGGIWHTGGALTLRDVVITANATGNGGTNATSGSSFGGWGGFGGGIYSSGTLTLTDCVVSNNTTGNGGTGGGSGGSGGRGAGIYFAPGTLTLNNVVISGNHTGNSGGPSSGNSGYGGGLWIGGDFFPSQNSTVNMNHVSITGNSTGNNITTGDSGGGAGIYIYQGTVTLMDCDVSNNHVGNANPNSFSGTAGSGGGIFNNGILTITNSLIRGNTTGDSAPGSNSTGGGISNNFTLKLINSTVSGNSTGTGPSMGGGLYVRNNATLVNCTITTNSTPSDFGNGVSGSNATITVANTIIAGNGVAGNSPDLNNPLFSPPTFVSQGHNLIGNADGFTFNAAGDQAGTGAAPLNPHLGPLANNGGPTFTHVLLSNSTALDAGDNALAKDASNNPLLTDQRGAMRIADSADADATATVDIGAFEFLQTLEDITDKTTNEDTQITVTFGLGDGADVTSVTASSNNQVLVPDANLVLTGAGAARTLQITPAANQSGLAMITVTVNLSGGGILTDTFGLTVLPVNDAPTFTKGPDQTLNEDAAAQSIDNWATGMSAGPNESAQALSFTVTNNFADLFTAAPAISSSGTLTYTLAPNRWGVATVTVVLKDDGGTTNGGQDSSAAQTFTITVTSVNDAPSFTKGADQTVTEDAAFQFINNWATNISSGPNESDPLTFQVTNNTNQSLFLVQPSVTTSGILTYMPFANASGSADITIVLKDLAGTANGGVDTSAAQTFTITVTPVNDAPFSNVPFFPQTNQQTPLVFSAANFNVISVGDVDAGADPIRVTLTATQGTLSLGSITGLAFTTGDGVADPTMTFTGTITAINAGLNGLTFTPNDGFSGTANLQIFTDDDGHNGAGGAKSNTTNVGILVRSGGRFSFNTANYGVNETGGTATITVLRAGGNAGTATVNYSTSSGTATSGSSCTSGVDFIATAGTFTWNNGDSSTRSFTVTICNDGLDEGNETINLTLSNAGGTGSLGTQPTATLTIGNDDGPPVILTEENTEHAIALDLVTQTRDPFSLTNLFNLSNDQHRRVSLFVWHLGLLQGDPISVVSVVARDDEGRSYDLLVESVSPLLGVGEVTQVVVRLPDNVIGAPRDLRVKVTLRERISNEAIIKIAP
jgi:CSLREA domain-containing protein